MASLGGTHEWVRQTIFEPPAGSRGICGFALPTDVSWSIRAPLRFKSLQSPAYGTFFCLKTFCLKTVFWDK